MAIRFNDSYLRGFLSEAEYASISGEVKAAAALLESRKGPGNDFIGWLDLPAGNEEELQKIEAAAEKIRTLCDVLVVIGICGSYHGARASVEFVRSARYIALPKENTPEILFAGCDLSPSTIAETLALLEGKRVCLNVISKSGTTTEPAVAFRIFRGWMEQKYGKDGAAERIFVTTDKCRGKLKELSDRMGYETFVVPDDVGGRFSVLTPVGLLPIAAAGINIREMLRGAADAKKESATEGSDAWRYVAARNLLYRQGRAVEIFTSYEPSLAMTAEWWTQLYGESEGKDGKGLFPGSVTFTTDLHSLGQFIQDGSNILFESVLKLTSPKAEVLVPDDPENTDGLNFLTGKSLQEICDAAFTATAMAHADGGTPTIVLECPGRSAYDFGSLVFFFEYACALSGYILGVNPFNQPGVEAYKKNMFALLGKPGADHEALRAKLLEKMGG